jgi:transcriptional regulator with XRE-family HTH domain
MGNKNKRENQLLINIGKQVRLRREKLGISQEELSDRCGLHRTYIGSVERGERNVSLINIFRICKALQVAIEDLFKGLRL